MNSSELAIFNCLPKEIIDEIIYIRMSRVHRQFMVQLNTEILYEYLLLKIEKFYIFCGIYTAENLTNRYINHNFTYHEKLQIIEFLNTCNCCSEHQIRKPTINDILQYKYPSYGFFGGTIKECKCCCRQFSRIMCLANKSLLSDM